MKRNLIVSLIAILFMSSICFGASYIIHDYDTGIMHMAQDIYLNNTRSVQTEIDSIEINLGTTYSISLKADKAGTLSQFTGGTNLNQIATRNHDDLQNISGNGTVHLSASEKSNYDTAYSHSQNTTSAHGLTISDVALKSGSLSQFTTRNASDINVTATSYGKGLATTDIDLQKVSNRVNQNGTPQFITDKTKCSLLLDFKGTLADRTRAINPIGSDAVNKWVDNYVNDSTSKEVATNISCTFKQFDGDEGLFGAGVAVEESRTNLVAYSQTGTNAYQKQSSGIVSPVGNDGIKFTCDGSYTGAGAYLIPEGVTANTTYTISFWVKSDNYTEITIDLTKHTPNYDRFCGTQTVYGITTKWQRKSIVITTNADATQVTARLAFGNYLPAGIVFYVDGVQLEAGAFPTSYIATGATAVTRPAGKLRFAHLINTGSDFSISAWYQFNSNSTIITPTPHLFEITDGTKRLNIYYDVPTQKIVSYVFNGSADIYQGADFTFNSNEKYNFTLKVASGILYVYCNKTLLYSFDMSLYKFETFYLDLGCRATTTDAFLNGTISNFEIYNYALSEAEISQIYNSGLEGKPAITTNPESIIGVGQTLHDPNFITFASGWGISTTYPNKPTLSKSSNVALMRGILEYSGVVNSDVTIFTLPIGARPSLPDTYYHSFVATARDSGSPAMRILRVYGNGDVKLMANGATITNPTISLDNINYVNGK